MKVLRHVGLALVLMITMCAMGDAQSGSGLLEQGIYAEETLGNLNEAIRIYQQVVADADAARPTAALALYRLGMCYRKGGQENQAVAVFEKLAKQYPEQKDLISKIPAPSPVRLSLKPAPWSDGEILRFDVGKKNAGIASSFGIQIFRVESVLAEGKSAWKIQSVQPSVGISVFTAVVANADTLIPVESRRLSRSMGIDTRAQYASDHIETSVLKNGAVVQRQVAIDRPAYDEDELVQLLRRLPLSENFKVSIPVFNANDDAASPLAIEVVGHETITVPAGSFDCYKVSLNGRRGSSFQSYWFSADSHVYPVKAESASGIEAQLHSVSVPKKGQSAYFMDEEFGIRLLAPAGWYICRMSAIPGYPVIGIIGLEDNEAGWLQVGDINKDLLEKPVPAKLASQYAEMMAKMRKRYELRPESGDAPKLDLPSASYIADTVELLTGQEIVEYVTIILSEQKQHIFIIYTAKESFDSLKPIYDSVISSLRVD